MSDLPLPVRDVLTDRGRDELAVERVMRGWRRRRTQRRHMQTAVTLGGAITLAASAWIAFTPRTAPPPSGLTLDGNRAARTFSTGATALSDRSRVVVVRGQVSVTDNTGRAFALRMQGAMARARFEVTPRGPRRWTVDCDGVVVEVTGTVFEVERAPGAVEVSVARGSVRVSGARVHPPRSLTAGERLRVELREVSAVARPASMYGPPEPVPPRALPSVAARSVATDTDALWRDLARRGDYAMAYDQLGNTGVARVERTATADELLVLADVARLSGHPAEAVSPLERVLREHASDPAAPLAAFALGRLELDALGHPARAAEAFERSLALGVSRSLEEDVRARLVEALVRAGERGRARQAAEEYLGRFPSGRRAGAVRRLVEVAP